MAALAIVFATALAASLALTPLARAIGIRMGMVDRPRAGEVQRWVRSRTGGYAIVLSFLLAVGLSFVLVPRDDPNEWMRLLGLCAGIAIVIPVALLDDRLRLGPMPQLYGQILAALVPIPFGLLVVDLSAPWGEIVPLPLFVAIPFTVVWVVGMINTLNWLDTMDGLAGGVSLIAAFVLLVRTLDQGQETVAVLPTALVAACLGFLFFNFSPARVFMGTSGSMFLGYTLAMLAVFGGAKLATTLMVLGLPILDTAFVIVQRLLGGRSPFQGGDSAHLAHKLAARGWGVRRIVLLFYGVSALLGAGGLVLSGPLKLWVFGAFLVVLLALTLWLFIRTRPAAAPRPSG